MFQVCASLLEFSVSVKRYAQNDKEYCPYVKMLQNYHIATLNLVSNHSYTKQQALDYFLKANSIDLLFVQVLSFVEFDYP